MFQWGPSNVNAQQSDAVLSNPSLAALLKQSAYAVPQGNIHGAWWDIARFLGVEAKYATSDADLQAALDDYSMYIDSLFDSSYENLWSVIGEVNGTMWDADFPMIEVSDDVWETVEAFSLNAGDQFKCRKGQSWEINYGGDGVIGGNNFVVEVSGSYIIRLTLLGDGTANIELIPQ